MLEEPGARRPPSVLGFSLTIVRVIQGWKQWELAAAVGTTRSIISGQEKGKLRLTREDLAIYAERMDYDDDLDAVISFAARRLAQRMSRGAADPEATERRAIASAAERIVRAGSDAVRLELKRAVQAERARRERKEAAALCQEVQEVPARALAALVERAREYQTRAFCEVLCRQSERAAADDPQKAIALAEAALKAAERTPGPAPRRRRAEGYAWAHVGNARRVANDHEGGDAAFSAYQEAWKAGAEDDDGFFDPALPLDLEASLRRDERRFDEALRLHDRALAVAPPGSVAYVLLNKAFTLEQAGRYERAVATLRKAARHVDAEREPRQLCVLQFNLATNLAHLDRYAEAEALVAEVQEMALASGYEIDLIRVVWLAGRVAAGLDRRQDATAAFEQVRWDFAGKGLAYDMALASLDLAQLYLEEGRTAEVAAIAGEMVTVFASRQIYREALAAVVLFRKAAEAEAATADLVHRLSRYLDRARREPDLRFEG
jgi:tetratricopeptide (TPR) repeat protein